MDSDYGRTTPPTKIIRDEPETPPTPVESVFIKEKSGSQVPYLAKLAAFSLLFLSVLYSLSSLVTYLVNKLMIKPETNNFNYSYFYGGDSFLVISAVSTLIVALPVAALLLFFVRRAENSESWRLVQKWRRIIYTVLQVVLIMSIISTLIGTIYSIFSLSLNLDVGSSYYGISGDSKKTDPQTSTKIAAAIITGFAAVLIYVLAALTLVGEYGQKWRQAAWGVMAVFAVTAGIIGTLSVVKVQEQIKSDRDSQSKYDQESQYPDYNDDYSSSDDAEQSGIPETSTLTSVQTDLSYYASKNNGQYPTKQQWDDGSLKPTYLLSSDETLKKITYAPTCTKSLPPVCSKYTLSMKGEDGKTITITEKGAISVSSSSTSS